MKAHCIESRRKEHPTCSKGKEYLLKRDIEGKVERTKRRRGR